MFVRPDNLLLASTRWHAASDAYAAQLAALERGAPGGLIELNKLCKRLRECQADVDALIND